MYTAFILKHPVVAPHADSVRRRRAPLKPSTRLICANDKPFVMRDADAVIVLGTVPNIDSRRRVERNLPAPARRADHSVCAGHHPGRSTTEKTSVTAALVVTVVQALTSVTKKTPLSLTPTQSPWKNLSRARPS